MRKLPLFALAAACFFATGFTDCDDFHTVVVPARDTAPPIAFAGVYAGGEYVASTIAEEGVTYHHPGAPQVAVSVAYDIGGARRVTMEHQSSFRCCDASVCSASQPFLASGPSDTQAGGVGAHVSDGNYVFTIVNLPRCPAGTTLRSFWYQWRTIAEDFHGNTRTSPFMTMVYP
ncbi:MAG: hypothetical protein R3B06_04065 [Kofleriaceae bacterium]